MCANTTRAARAIAWPLAAAALALGSAPARADDAAPAAAAPPNYVVALLGTTLADRPSGGPMNGWGHDLSPAIGVGRFIRETIAIELDVGPTMVSGDYVAFSLVPGVVWAFSPHIYAAARFVVPVDPQVNLGLYPGVGAIYSFDNGISLVAELSVFSYVGRGDPDLGVAMTGGALYGF